MMQEPALYAWGNRWFRWSVFGLGGLTVAALLVGFVWLPKFPPPAGRGRR